MKYLLWIVLFLVVYFALRPSRNTRGGQARRPTSRAPERMVTCAHCGVNMPISDSIRSADDRYFCCNEHLQANNAHQH